jgi:hypothetical protein
MKRRLPQLPRRRQVSFTSGVLSTSSKKVRLLGLLGPETQTPVPFAPCTLDTTLTAYFILIVTRVIILDLVHLLETQ